MHEGIPCSLVYFYFYFYFSTTTSILISRADFHPDLSTPPSPQSL